MGSFQNSKEENKNKNKNKNKIKRGIGNLTSTQLLTQWPQRTTKEHNGSQENGSQRVMGSYKK